MDSLKTLAPSTDTPFPSESAIRRLVPLLRRLQQDREHGLHQVGDGGRHQQKLSADKVPGTKQDRQSRQQPINDIGEHDKSQ